MLSTLSSAIVTHLHKISSLVKQVKNNEYQIFCVYCDDAVRKPNPRHGHLYVLIDEESGAFLFHCFRCGASGHLYKLLVDTGFQDRYVLDRLRKTKIIFSNIKTRSSKGVGVVHPTLPDHIITDAMIFFKRRTGVHRYWEFGVVPQVRNNVFIGFDFYNWLGQKVCTRVQYNGNRFFKKYDGWYFFQDLYAVKNGVVIVEGPFDAINAYLYHWKDPLTVAALGKSSMITCLEWLITHFGVILEGKTVRIMLDSDVQRWKMYKYKTQRLQKLVSFQCQILRTTKYDIADWGLYEVLDEF